MMRVGLAVMLVTGAVIGLALPVSRVAMQAESKPARTGEPSRRPAFIAPADDPAVAGDTIIRRDAAGHFVADAVVNGVALPMIVDTGADVVALTVDDARAAHITVDPNTFTVIGRGASGDVRGMIVTLDNVAIAGRTVSGVRGAVIEGLDRSLLGQSYRARTGGVTMTNDEMRLS